MNRNWKRQIILACTFSSLIPLNASAAELEILKSTEEESRVIYSSKVTTQSKEENQITARQRKSQKSRSRVSDGFRIGLSSAQSYLQN